MPFKWPAAWGVSAGASGTPRRQNLRSRPPSSSFELWEVHNAAIAQHTMWPSHAMVVIRRRFENRGSTTQSPSFALMDRASVHLAVAAFEQRCFHCCRLRSDTSAKMRIQDHKLDAVRDEESLNKSSPPSSTHHSGVQSNSLAAYCYH